MPHHSTQRLSRGYIPPPQLAEVGAAADLAGYLRILVILASPAVSDRPALNLRAEWKAVSAAIKRQAAPVACYRLTPPTWDALHQALARPGAWPVVNVSAHGEEEGLYLEDEYGEEVFVPAERLASAFIDSRVKLVVLNACSSQNPARALVAAGVPAVVATTTPIDTHEAQRLAEDLYAALSGGRSIADSLDFACRALDAPHVPVLEAQPGGGEAVLCPEPQPGLHPILSDSLPPRSSALPSQFAFVGRGPELVKIANRLDDPGTRTVRITGLGGVGKTTLAAEVAHRQAWRFPDGVIWISTQNLPNLGLADLLREIDQVLSLGVQDETPDTRRQVAMDALRERACLLVVDGFEEVAEDERGALLRFLGGLGAWGHSKAMLVGRLASPDTETLEGSYPLPLDGLAECDALDKLKAQAELKEVPKLLTLPVKELLSWARGVGFNPAMIEWLVGLRDIARIRHTVRSLPRAY